MNKRAYLDVGSTDSNGLATNGIHGMILDISQIVGSQASAVDNDSGFGKLFNGLLDALKRLSLKTATKRSEGVYQPLQILGHIGSNYEMCG